MQLQEQFPAGGPVRADVKLLQFGALNAELKPQPVTLDFDDEVAQPTRGRLWELILGEINHYKIIKSVAQKTAQ